MAEDWLSDVRKYSFEADEDVVGSIVKYCGIALRNRDSSLVSFSDDAEVARVRDKFLRRKLGLTDADSLLDDGIAWVKNLMVGDRTKNRVTVYYLLSHYFGKLDLFGGPAGTSSSSLAGAVLGGTGAAAPSGVGSSHVARSGGSKVPVGRVEPASPVSNVMSQSADSGVGQETDVASVTQSASSTRAQTALPISGPPAYAAHDLDKQSGLPRWLIWTLIALAVLAIFFLVRGCASENEQKAVARDTDTTLSVDGSGDPVGTAGTAAPVPVGAGVISELRDGKPSLTVYFESAKAAVSNDLAAASANLKTYLDVNPEARLAVSGYNDPSGNAAANAELSKSRAQAVAAALVAAGISQASIELVKPDVATSISVTPEQARRVEVSIR